MPAADRDGSPALLADRLPDGRVYAVDVAPSMAEHAQHALGERATVLCQDLVALELPEPVDAIFSNATFHWIHDHDALFAALARAMKPGAGSWRSAAGAATSTRSGRSRRMIAHRAAVRAVLRDLAQAMELRGRGGDGRAPGARGLRRGAAAGSSPRRVTPADPRSFVQTVCLVRHLDPLPEELREPFLEHVLGRAGEPLVLDYVRLI